MAFVTKFGSWKCTWMHNSEIQETCPQSTSFQKPVYSKCQNFARNVWKLKAWKAIFKHVFLKMHSKEDEFEKLYKYSNIE